MAKKQQSKKKATIKKEEQLPLRASYDMFYLMIGLMIFFVSLLALFDGGFIGVLFTNTFRLLIGETYTLVLFSMALYAFMIIIKGRLPRVKWTKYLGAILILVALTTVLHFNTFNGLEPSQIFARTYDVFRNDLLTNQNRTNLGGGLLGACFYAAFGYLFGRWGTYLFAFIIFVLGFGLVESITIDQLGKLVLAFGNGMITFPKKIFPTFTEMKEVFNQGELIDDEAERPLEAFEPIQPSSTRSRKQSKLSQLFSAIKSAPNNDEWAESSYQPSFQERKRVDFEPFDERTQRVAPRIEREERVLDLDYFDKIASFNDKKAVADKHQAIIQRNDIVPEPEEVLETPAAKVVATPPEQPVNPVVQAAPVPAPTVSAPLTPRQTADHWQAQATTKQDLTEDDLDKLLAAESNTDTTQPAVKPKRSHHYQLPSKSLLKKIPPVDQSEEYARINENIEKLERTFDSFGVKAKVVKANLGPSVTKYEIEPAIGVKVSKIVSLSDDIALALAARDVRMEAPIPGKSLIGIEVPNLQVSPVSFWEIIDAALESENLLDVPLGRDISGTVCLADLSKMPHLLIAGATGSGKSVGMNVIIVSLLMKAHPDDVKFLMIDPKKVELTMYDDLPHQLAPVVTNPRKAAQALNKVVQEMERRYELFAASNVRNIDTYNEQVDEWNKEDTGTVYEKLPKIIVFVDELADLMMVASNEVESAIIRLAQMARAAGIHMIIATQRPSVDVITGIIKANVPSRLAFAVSSGTDSRTILDSVGAEKLLGRGDMLFQPMGKNKPVRVQGAYISDSEVEKITNFIKDQQVADYEDSLINLDDEQENSASVSEDEYFDEAVEMLQGLETISISQLQRKFRIGYNRAARLIDDMEAAGLVSGQDGSKPRQVL
ncbi:DNA translocase FtsK [Tuanshanicoccus lijuaniae]|uniref:DNA translocase FtsK n=1 Tax=Aerococcaceae bacterium zg-1292 TaxID=2774330 RepID=UPI0040631AAB